MIGHHYNDINWYLPSDFWSLKMDRDHCIAATHRETYFPRLVKHVAGEDGGKFNFVSPEGKPTTFTLREAYNAMEMLEMRWGEKWSFEVIHIEAL